MMKKLFYVFTTLLLLIGNFAVAQTFVVCDTECRSFPLGDCNTEHTDTDNIEWPCEIILDDVSIAANQTTPNDLELLPNVDSLDVRPQIVGIADPASRIAISFADNVFTSTSGYKILREWTVLDWLTGTVATYNQVIKNNYGILLDCSILYCYNGLEVELPAGNMSSLDIWVTDILAQDYSHCDLDNYLISLTDANGNVFSGNGMVSTSEAGVYTAAITEPSGNTCLTTLTVLDGTTSGGNCTLICNDQIMVSLAATPTGPSATLITDVFLEGPYPNCDITTFGITATDPLGNSVSGIGSITVTEVGTYPYIITDPASGNQCWGTMIVEDRSGPPCNDPFEICDTECRSTPIGDCTSGHTDTDNVEWPCDITLDDAAISAQDVTPDDLENLVDPLDARPTLVNEGCNLIGETFNDQVIDLGADGFKIIRTWTLLNWHTGNAYEYAQVIKNLSGSLFDCSILYCYNGLEIELPAGNMSSLDIWVTDILAQDYSHCDLENYLISLTDVNGNVVSGNEMVSTTEAGVYTATITEPTGNTCWTTLTVLDGTTSGGNCTLSCNDQVMVALGPTTSGPSATLEANVFLEGAYPNCDISTFEMTATDAAGNSITGIGSITITEVGTYTYTITDPTTGNQCWGTMIAEYRGGDPCNDPFEICDTECRSTPIGDCASGHTDTDNVEWPCDVTLDDVAISAQDVSPDDLESLVDPLDARPTLVNEGCNLVGNTFHDQVFNLRADGFKIIRTWTLVHWNSGNVYEYIQIIKNTSGLVSDCGALACNGLINASLAQTPGGLSATLDSDVFLEGGYPNCDLSSLVIVLTDAVGNTITGTGEVTVTEEGTFTYTITDPVTGNSCWGTLEVENKNPSNCTFIVCDTECRTAPLGDCASGHTDTDNVEWPCDITLDIAGLTAPNLNPNDLLSINGVDERDTEPVFVNFDVNNCSNIETSFYDTVIDDGTNGFSIVRVWTIINWETTNVYEYSQIIKNLSPGIQALCKPLECKGEIVASIANNSEVTITAPNLLEGEYPNCDLENLALRVEDENYNTLATGIGSISLSHVGKMFYTVAELETNNFCRGEITIEVDPNSTSNVAEARALEAINVYPNPATDVLLFDYKNLDLKGDISISILDQSGRTLLQEINNNRLNINVLNNGLYIYQIRLNDEVRYGKFTVLR